jgi:hypothetical protein
MTRSPDHPIANRLFLGIFQVGIAVQAVLVELEEPARFDEVQAPLADGQLDVGPELPDKRVRVELDGSPRKGASRSCSV